MVLPVVVALVVAFGCQGCLRSPGHSFAAALSGPFAATGTVLRFSEALGPWRIWTGLSHEASDECLGAAGAGPGLGPPRASKGSGTGHRREAFLGPRNLLISGST